MSFNKLDGFLNNYTSLKMQTCPVSPKKSKEINSQT